MADTGVAGERFAFDDSVWAEEVGRFDVAAEAHSSAIRARRDMERRGARIPVRPCETEGLDGTRLVGCAKVYVPVAAELSRAPYGFVFALRSDPSTGRVRLLLLAFGECHPRPGVRSVYERAHKRLHGRYPDE